MTVYRWLKALFVLLWVALLEAQGAAEGLDVPTHPFELVRADDIRVGETFFRLATANVDACLVTRPMTGLLIHHLLDYPRRSRRNLVSLFERPEAPTAYGVIAGSPAAAAGLRPGDSLLAVDGHSMIEVATAASNSKALAGAAVDQAIGEALRAGPATLTYLRDGRSTTTMLASVPGCAARFVMLPSGRINSYAGNDTIAVTTGLLRLARNDSQLAVVLGHEMAHIIFDARWQAAHEKHRKGSAVELAADRAGIIMMARAGYDPEQARIFWNEFPHGALAALFPGEHPASKVRKAAVARTIAEITAAHGAKLAF